LSSGLNYKIGEFIGVISGHSIGERGTQLSMKTFQTGESGFNMQRVSKIFFQRIEEKIETDDYIQYLLNLSYTDIQELMVNGNRYILKGKNKKAPEKPLLDTIDVSSIYFEILFSSLVKRKVNNETEAKKYLMDFEKNGFFSSISFQSNIKGINELKKESEIKETVFFEKSPKAIYSLKPGEVIKYASEIE
jgi:DNA-directed RNA polymerase subunit beta